MSLESQQTSNVVQINLLCSICIALLFDLNQITVANFKWDADKFTLLHLYLTLVRSRLEYSFIVYGSARISFLKTLDAIHLQSIRVCIGAFRTSPPNSLYVEANEPPLDLRRLKLTLQYMVKLKANIDNPAFDCVFHPQLEHLYDKK